MKQVFLFSILAICISCFSCDKVKNNDRKYRRQLNGDWEWINSTSGKNGETLSYLINSSPANTGTNYGLRIRSSDKAFLYKNGKQIKEGELEGIERIPYSEPGVGGGSDESFQYQVTLNFSDETIILTGKFKSLSCKTWPYDNSYNQLKKNK